MCHTQVILVQYKYYFPYKPDWLLDAWSKLKPCGPCSCTKVVRHVADVCSFRSVVSVRSISIRPVVAGGECSRVGPFRAPTVNVFTTFFGLVILEVATEEVVVVSSLACRSSQKYRFNLAHLFVHDELSIQRVAFQIARTKSCVCPPSHTFYRTNKSRKYKRNPRYVNCVCHFILDHRIECKHKKCFVRSAANGPAI